jgi:hypothetical protein
LVVLCCLSLALSLPQQFLSGEPNFGWREISQLVGVMFGLALVIAPLDFLGGYYLPRKYGKSTCSLKKWASFYLPALLAHGGLYVAVCAIIIAIAQSVGKFAGISFVVLATGGLVWFRSALMSFRRISLGTDSVRLDDALGHLRRWSIKWSPVQIVTHTDDAFTGGIVGVGPWTRIVIPHGWLKALSSEALAVVLARRSLAISSGSYRRGLILAGLWNIAGFTACATLPGCGIASVAELTTLLCGFTLWSFVGLLILPSASRRASSQMDHLLAERGIADDLIVLSAKSLDRLQDDEPQRPRWIERIFHPIPSVASRQPSQSVTGPTAWNVARNALYLSWACGGFLSRSVHCNVGRPELWAMLPSD